MKNFGEFSFDPKQKCLRKNGKRVDLRPKSLSVLEHLLEMEGEIVSKIQLLERSWQDAIVTEDSLFQCIRELRAVLGESNQQKFIQTVPKQGYIWVYQEVPQKPKIAKRWGLGAMILFCGLFAFWPRQPPTAVPQEDPSYTLLFLPATFASKGLADWVPHGFPQYMAERWNQIDHTNTLSLQDLGYPQKQNFSTQNTLAQKAHLGFLTGSDWVVEFEVSQSQKGFSLRGSLIGQDLSLYSFVGESSTLIGGIEAWEKNVFKFLKKQMGWHLQMKTGGLSEDEVQTYCKAKQAVTFGRLNEALQITQNMSNSSAELFKAELRWRLGKLDMLPIQLEANTPKFSIAFWQLKAEICRSKSLATGYKKALFQCFREAGLHGKIMEQCKILLLLSGQSLEESNLDLAQHHGFQALYFAQRLSSKILLFEANTQMGKILFQQGFEKEAMRYFEAALKHAEVLQDQSKIAQILYEMGSISHQLGLQKDALAYFQKARDHFFMQGDLVAVESCQRLIESTR